MLEINKIYNETCIDGMMGIPNDTIDLIITSPPYKEKDGYNPYLMGLFLVKSYDILKNNSLLFLNFGHLSEDKFRPFQVCKYAITSGFKLNDTIIWVKNHFTPLNGKKHLNNLTEFIFILYKGEMPNLDRLSIGIPYKDKSNAKRYNNSLDLRCAGNVWNIDIPTITNKSQRLHKDEFPLELPTKCIKLSGLPQNSLILEPFAGSGTTCLAAKNLNMNYIGFEKNKEYFNISTKRLGLI